MFLYAIMPSFYWVLGIALLQGPSYVPFLVGSVAYANELAPADLKATSQGLLATILNLASLVGGFVCGWLFDQLGRQGLFAILGGICLTALLFFVGGQRLQRQAQLE
jgi:MFS family permease